MATPARRAIASTVSAANPCSHTKLLIDPGHNRTRFGGPDAPLDPAESVPAVVDVLESAKGPGLRFLDRHGETVPW